MHDLPGFLLAALVLTGSPGPANLSLVAAGAAFGAHRCLGYVSGLVMGMVLVMTMTATGVVGVLLASPEVAPLIGGVAVAYFVTLAFRIALAPPMAESDLRQPAPSIVGGIILSLFNPKAYAAMAALFSGFVLMPEHLEVDAIAKIAILTPMVLLVQGLWLVSGAAFTRLFRQPRSSRMINLGFATVLLLSLALSLMVSA